MLACLIIMCILAIYVAAVASVNFLNMHINLLLLQSSLNSYIMQGHIILGIGDLRSGPSIPFEKVGVMSCVAASPNDPAFINHHGMVDCILEEWLQRNKDKPYPTSDEIREGHRADDYIVPIMPLYMQRDMYKTADNFGYSCSLPDGGDGSGSVSVQAYTGLAIVVALLAAACTSSY